MKKGNRIQTTMFVSILLAFTLVGYATSPTSAGSPGERLQFPAYKFSVMSPAENWEIPKEAPSHIVIAWRSPVTNSTIAIMASDDPMTQISDSTLVKFFAQLLRAGLRRGKNPEASMPGQYPEVSFTSAEEKEVSFNGKRFFLVSVNFSESPVEGMHVTTTNQIYILSTEEFMYTIHFNAVTGHYDKDVLTLEDVLRSFTLLE